MLGLDQGLTGSPVPIWAAGAFAALLLAIGLVAFQRAAQAGHVGHLARGALVLVGVLLGWGLLPRNDGDDLAAARRALEARAVELTARAIAPGSAFACLDAVANPAVEAACEKALFASPETVAAALSYVDARLSLLIDGLELAARDPSYGASLARLRLGIESDRYGFVAQALATRGCQDENCPLLKLLGADNRAAVNLKERLFDANVVLHAANWPREGAALASTSSTPAPAAAPSSYVSSIPAASTAPAAPVRGRYDFPSASSIPPISIMNAEPVSPPAPANAASADGKPESKSAPPARQAPPPARQAPPPARRQSAREPTAHQSVPITPSPPPPPPAGNSSSVR